MPNLMFLFSVEFFQRQRRNGADVRSTAAAADVVDSPDNLHRTSPTPRSPGSTPSRVHIRDPETWPEATREPWRHLPRIRAAPAADVRERAGSAGGWAGAVRAGREEEAWIRKEAGELRLTPDSFRSLSPVFSGSAQSSDPELLHRKWGLLFR